MKVTAVSGYGAKGPACFLVELEDRRLLLDLGEGPGAGQFPDLSALGHIDAVIISHGHTDHVGGLHLIEHVGSPPVYATAMVRRLGDSQILRNAEDLPLNGATTICGISVETGRAGHAPGGVWMRIGGPDGVLYSGDFSREGALYPYDDPLPARLLIVDASYGAYNDPLSKSSDFVIKAAKKSPFLLPSPAAGRGLEMALLLHEHGISIGLCDDHRSVAQILLSHHDGEMLPGAAERLAMAVSAANSLDAQSKSIGAMIAANATASGGLARHLLSRFLDDNDVGILFTGYADKSTPAGKLIVDGRAQFVRWNVHPPLFDLHWLIEKVAPSAVMPAFLPLARMQELSDALGAVNLSGPILA